MQRVMTVRQRLQPFWSVSRLQTDHVTYGLLESVADSTDDSAGRGERACSDGTRRTDVADVEHAAREGRMEMIQDVPTYALIKLAAKLAKDGQGENAQFLRDCVDDARRFRWLVANDPTTSTIYLATDNQKQSMHPDDIRARIDTEANEAMAKSVARFTRNA